MRRTPTTYLLLLAAVLLLTAAGTAPRAFVKKAANFSVMMPGTPKEQTTTESTAAGPIKLYQASVVAGTSAWFVGYSDMPKATWNGDAKKMLEGARDGAAARVGGRVVADREITLAGTYPGREFKLVVQDKMEMTQRVYLVKHRLYQVSMGCMVQTCTDEDAQAYLDTFKLLTVPKPTKPKPTPKTQPKARPKP